MTPPHAAKFVFINIFETDIESSNVPNANGPVADISGAGFWFRLTGEDVPAGPQGYTGTAGPQGPDGPLGGTGITGPQGLAGPQGGPGDVNIWYESWNPTVCDHGNTGVNSKNVVYWHAFIAPQTGIYTNIKVRCAFKNNSTTTTLYAGVSSSYNETLANTWAAREEFD